MFAYFIHLIIQHVCFLYNKYWMYDPQGNDCMNDIGWWQFLHVVSINSRPTMNDGGFSLFRCLLFYLH